MPICSISSSSLTFAFWSNCRSLLITTSSRKNVSRFEWTSEGSNYFTTPRSALDVKRACCLKSRALIMRSCEVSFGDWHMAFSSWWSSVPNCRSQCARCICLHFRKVSFKVVTKCDLSFKLGPAAGINTSIIPRSSNPFLRSKIQSYFRV